MEPKSRSSNTRKNFNGNNSRPGSPMKKRRVAQEEIGWLKKMSKSFFFTLSIALIAVILSQYWPQNILNHLSQSQRGSNEAEQGRSMSDSERKTTQIKLPSGYSPSCPIRGKESISAINRAITDSCKIDIADLACKTVDAIGDLEGVGNFYPTHLPNYCPTVRTINPELEGNYLGK